MTLYTLSIRRPVLATVMSITIVLFGLIGFRSLGIREFPSVDAPEITVSTNYRGASADVIETQITEPLEESVNGIAGIRTLTSVSREGRSTLTVEFDLDTDLETAANDVRDRVARAMRNLPPDVDPPTISKSNADEPPIVQITIRSDRRSLLDLSRIADELFAERLQTIPGVSQVDIWGDQTPAMRLWIDPQKLAAYRLSPLDVQRAVERENVELPAGRIEGTDVELPVRTMSRLESPADFENMILKAEGGSIVRFRDVGAAELGPRNLRTVLKRDGIPMVAVVARPQPGANYIEIVDEFRRRIGRIENELPADVEIAYGFDATEHIRKSVTEVRQTILVAFALVILVIFAFLRDWRTTLIPVVVIPVSLIGAFFIMYAAGFSINVLTLLALVLAIGLVVDDAIVVLENIYAKIEAGNEPISAGVHGTREIFFAVIATTLALVAVLMPLLFIQGLVGQLFREFGIVLAGAVLISSFVALTLTPMLSSRFLKKRARHPWLYRVTEPFFLRLIGGYRSSLRGWMARRWLAIPAILASVGQIVLFLDVLPSELAPLEDRSNLRLQINGPEGATFEYMDRYIDQLDDVVMEAVPETDSLVSVTSPGFGATSAVNSGFARLILSDPKKRQRTQNEIAADLGRQIRSLTGAHAFVTQEPTIAVGRRRGLPVQFVLQAPNLEKLKEVLPRFQAAVEAHPALSEVDVDLKFNKPELQVGIDRERARDLGVSTLDVARTLQLTLSEQRLGFFVRDGKQFEVIGQVTRENRDESFDLRNLYVPAGSGTPVLLDKLVSVAEESATPQRFRFDRYVSATVSAGLAPGKTIADGIAAMREIADEILDDSFSTALSGESRDYAESASSLVFVFLLALVLIYLVLAAQFESFRDPLIIMFTVPLALAGALLSLWYFNLTLNIFSQIGMIMLIGLVTKNGILIVEFANQRRGRGRSVTDAILDAAAARFRPVLMTTLSTVLGILPIALALGAGAESRVPMGVAIIGGLLVGTVLTLYVVPAMYSYVSSKQERSELAWDVEIPAASEVA
jgi:multidrug efflux pump